MMKKTPVVSKKTAKELLEKIYPEIPVDPLPLVDEFPETPQTKPPKPDEPLKTKEPSLFARKVDLLRVQFGKSESMHSEKQINAALNLRIIELLEEIRDGLHSG
ncbi:hypothetical protein LCGC14_1850310 [marine sediment metagenome]|uniref:Uncharacterized protein n=1 Tax=marine sediment metagenome TaxID=412755 RepID=A0A0F9GAU4_9ZZZZ|nr:hypothetical protein [Desulfobacterales bacterium]